MRDIISHIKPYSTKRVFKKHAILLYQGEAPRLAYVVLSGVVKVYSINTAGEEQIVTFETRDDILPTPWIFNKASTTLYYYEALTDCEVLAVVPEKLLSYTWNSSGDEAGRLATVVTFTLTPTNGGTHLRMEQSGFRPDNEQNYQGAQYGWQKFLAELDRVVAGL